MIEAGDWVVVIKGPICPNAPDPRQDIGHVFPVAAVLPGQDGECTYCNGLIGHKRDRFYAVDADRDVYFPFGRLKKLDGLSPQEQKTISVLARVEAKSPLLIELIREQVRRKKEKQ